MTKDLTRGTPWRLIVQFALPIMAGNLLQQLYNTADTIIVGNFNGQQALSAVGACASLTVLFTALAIGFSIGAGVLISQYFGASREQALRQYAATAIVLMLAMGLLMSLIGVCSAGFLLARALGTPEALLPLTLLYFRIYAAGLVFQFGYNIAAALLRALGDSKATLYFLLVSSVLNVVLDLAFVAGLGMGVAGAAIATVISQIASCGIGFAYMHRRYALLRFSLRELRMDLKTAGRILQVGAPMAIQQSIVSCGFLFLQRLVNYYGESMIASYTVASRMENILMIPIIGIQNTMATFAGQNMGAQRPDRVSNGLGQGVLVSLGMTLILCLAQIAGIPLIIRAFQLDAGAAAICRLHLFSSAVAIPIFAVYFPANGMCQGVGEGFHATFYALLALGLRVVFAYALHKTSLFGYTAIWWSQAMSWTITLVVCYVHFFRGKWKDKSLIS
ncbi:MAG: MATE family efflux transporter [Clostridiales bacterium]|nr:MATE family efflux transporter [Clostridiales bacterium]